MRPEPASRDGRTAPDPDRRRSHPPPDRDLRPGAASGIGPVAYRPVGAQRRAVTSGVLAGLAGAAAFLVFCMAVWAVTGGGVWQPLNLVAHTFWQGAPDDGGFHPGAALLGLAILGVAGLALGLPLVLLLHNIGPPHWGMTLALAIVIPNVLWVPGHGLIWPAIDTEAAAAFTPLWAWLGHGVYGLVLGLVLLVTGPPDLRPFGRQTR